jgi:hypothetical protein
MRKLVAATALAGIATLTTSLALANEWRSNEVQTVPTLSVTSTPSSSPCKTEDSDGPCYWDAQHRGNGKGKSFRVLKNGKVEYLKAWTVDDQGKRVMVCGFDEQDVLSLNPEHYNDPTPDPKNDATCNEG